MYCRMETVQGADGNEVLQALPVLPFLCCVHAEEQEQFLPDCLC